MFKTNIKSKSVENVFICTFLYSIPDQRYYLKIMNDIGMVWILLNINDELYYSHGEYCATVPKKHVQNSYSDKLKLAVQAIKTGVPFDDVEFIYESLSDKFHLPACTPT